jgi:ATP-dependent protease ClpP protease subunit
MELLKNITKENIELFSKFNDLNVTCNFYFEHPDKDGKIKANIKGDVNDKLLNTFWDIEEKYNDNVRGKWFEEQVKGIDINFSSPGGSCYTCFQIVDFVRLWNENHQAKINFHAQGIVASAGVIIFLMGEKRTASLNSLFMIHELHSWIDGKLTEMKDYIHGFQLVQNLLNKIILERSSMTEEKFNELVKHDYFFTPQEALEIGIVHEII